MSEQTIYVTIEEDQPINIELQGCDFVNGGVSSLILAQYLKHETPTKISATRFQTSCSYTSGHLLVFYNGLKEKYITEVSSTQFELPIATVIDDIVEVYYLKQ